MKKKNKKHLNCGLSQPVQGLTSKKELTPWTKEELKQLRKDRENFAERVRKADLQDSQKIWETWDQLDDPEALELKK